MLPKTPISRLATIEDIDNISILALALSDERELNFDITSVLRTTTIGVTQGITVVSELDGDIVGVIAVQPYASPYHDGIIEAQQLIWYVRYDYRKDGIGVNLYNALEIIARDKGVNRLIMSSPNVGGYSFDKFFESKLFKKCDTLFIKEI